MIFLIMFSPLILIIAILVLWCIEYILEKKARECSHTLMCGASEDKAFYAYRCTDCGKQWIFHETDVLLECGKNLVWRWRDSALKKYEYRWYKESGIIIFPEKREVNDES